MAKIGNIKRIITEDFPSDMSETIEKIGLSFNSLSDQITQAFDKRIDFENLNQAYVTLDIKVNSSGEPLINNQLKNPLRTNIKGINIISAQSLEEGSNLLTGAPFIVYSINSDNTIKINQLLGLPSDKKFRLGLILIG
jgi:hypothetical protein